MLYTSSSRIIQLTTVSLASSITSFILNLSNPLLSNFVDCDSKRYYSINAVILISRVCFCEKRIKLRRLISVMWHATSLEKSCLVIVRKKIAIFVITMRLWNILQGSLSTCKLLPMQYKVQLVKQRRWSKFLLVRIARCEGQHFWQLITKSRLKNKHTTSSWSQGIFQFCNCCWFRSRSSSTPFIVMFSIEF